MKSKKNLGWNPEAFPTYWINCASRLILRRFEKCLRPLDVGWAYVPVAFELEQDGELLQKDLAGRIKVEQPTMAALLTRMERDGMICRNLHPDDHRASFISLTPKGRAKIPEIKQRLLQEAQTATAGFSDAETKMLMSLLERVVHNCRSAPKGERQASGKSVSAAKK